MTSEGIVTVIQARTGSSRLPGKVMMPLCEAPLLLRMIERVQQASLKGQLIVATTTETSDDPIEILCQEHDIACFRGSVNDLLERHYQAAIQFPGTHSVIKIPSDCPLIDPRIIDEVIAFYLSRYEQYDFVSNLHPASFPDGNDVEIMKITALEEALAAAGKPLEREHTTPYFWENPDKFRIGNLLWDSGLDYSMSHRFTIDYPEDYTFIKTVYEALYPSNPFFGLEDILDLLEKHPEIYMINAHYAGVNWYRNHLDELKTVGEAQTKKTE